MIKPEEITHLEGKIKGLRKSCESETERGKDFLSLHLREASQGFEGRLRGEDAMMGRSMMGRCAIPIHTQHVQIAQRLQSSEIDNAIGVSIQFI